MMPLPVASGLMATPLISTALEKYASRKRLLLDPTENALLSDGIMGPAISPTLMEVKKVGPCTWNWLVGMAVPMPTKPVFGLTTSPMLLDIGPPGLFLIAFHIKINNNLKIDENTKGLLN
jgi:hypothetical protein